MLFFLFKDSNKLVDHFSSLFPLLIYFLFAVYILFYCDSYIDCKGKLKLQRL